VIIVSDTSSLMNLAVVGHLQLLHQLYATVLIPEAVWNELTALSSQHPEVATVQTLTWLERQPVTSQAVVNALQAELDIGEAEAIALAVEKQADLLLIDERRGRQVATRMGLTYIGLLGVLLEAKRKAFLPEVKPVLDELVAKAGFWVSRELYTRVLRAAGE
jgi:predicted nucleic acid-binding protein